MANKYRNKTTGTWGFNPANGVPHEHAERIASELRSNNMTVEEAITAMNSTGNDVRGFWDETQARRCALGKPMQDISKSSYPNPVRIRNGRPS